MFRLKNIKKSKIAAVAIGAAVKVLTAVVCGAVVLTGTYGVVKHNVLPTSTAKTKSMFAYEGGADTGGGSGGSAGDNPVYVTEIKRLSGAAVPEGAKYTKADGTVLTSFPDAPATGDTYEEGDYLYSYNKGGNYGIEWSVKIKDNAKTEYGEIISNIASKEIVSAAFAFNNCSSLKKAPIIPNTVTNMFSAFWSCTSLVSAPIIPNGVTNMYNTFYHCTSLLEAPTIPDSVTNMKDIFMDCASLRTYKGNNDKDGDFSKYKIPDNISDIGRAFNGCTSLVIAPVIPEGITDVSGTFAGCTSLTTSPKMPITITKMYQTFRGCSSLTEAPTIPNGVTSMEGTFESCRSLTVAPTIPNSVTNMRSTFRYCDSLISPPKIPSSVINLMETFDYCKALTVAPEIPNGVTNLYCTFQGCTSLTTAPTIPNSVTNMTYTFSGCTSLTTAPTIPNSVINMNSTFKNCKSLTGTITVNAKPTDYRKCFLDTQSPIFLTGSSTKLAEIAATANNGNVTVK